MPVDAFVAHLGVLAQKLICQRQRRRIVFEICKDFRLALRVVIPSQLAIDEHQIVMGYFGGPPEKYAPALCLSNHLEV